MAIVSAFLGPLIGVLIAWSLARRDRREGMAFELFRSIYRTMMEYFFVFAEFYVHDEERRRSPDTPPDPRALGTLARMKTLTAELNSSKFGLHMLFGDKTADPIAKVIEELISCEHMFDDPGGLPPIEVAQGRLMLLTTRLSQELNALYRSMANRDWE